VVLALSGVHILGLPTNKNKFKKERGTETIK
jgi:hypothetical protein